VNGRAYKTMLYVGCVMGVYAGAAVADERGLSPSTFALMTVALLIPAFAGARAWFVLRHLDGYRHTPRRIAARTEGGAGLFGGLTVAIAVSLPVLHLAGMPFWTFWDAATVTMLIGLFFTRFGCLMNGCCAGRPTGSRFGLVLTDFTGERRRRYPTQLVEASVAAVVLAAAIAARDAVPTGVLFAGVVVTYCAARAALQPLREVVTLPTRV